MGYASDVMGVNNQSDSLRLFFELNVVRMPGLMYEHAEKYRNLSSSYCLKSDTLKNMVD